MKIEKLPAVCKIQYGYPFDSALFSEKEGHPLIRIRDVVRGYTETYTTEKCSDEYLVNQGDILIGMDGMFNVAKWKGSPAFLNQRVCRLIPGEKIDSEYLYYFMPKALKKIEEATPFVTVKHLKAKQLNDINFPMLPLMEQKKIAQQLVKIDYLLECRKIQLQKLNELVKSRFIEMFGDQTNSLKWPVVCVQDIASVQVGVVIKPAQYYTDKEHGIKTFRSLNIGPMFIKDNDWVYFSKEGNQKNEKSQLKENDLLIVRSGAPGTACVITKDYEGCNAVDVIIAHPMLEVVNPYYLCAYTNFPHGKIQIEGGIGGAAQQHFNVGKYNKVKVMLPPLELQNGFEKFFKQINKSKLAIRKSLDDLETLKKSLMQQYFG